MLALLKITFGTLKIFQNESFKIMQSVVIVVASSIIICFEAEHANIDYIPDTIASTMAFLQVCS